MVRFEWDETKNRLNRTKHGVWLEEAQSVFDDPRARVFFDPAHSEDEDRFLILGMTGAARLLVVAHCYRKNDEVVRIISARRATRREARTYEQGI